MSQLLELLLEQDEGEGGAVRATISRSDPYPPAFASGPAGASVSAVKVRPSMLLERHAMDHFRSSMLDAMRRGRGLIVRGGGGAHDPRVLHPPGPAGPGPVIAGPALPHGPLPHGPLPHGPPPHGPQPHGPQPHGPLPHGPLPHGPLPHPGALPGGPVIAGPIEPPPVRFDEPLPHGPGAAEGPLTAMPDLDALRALVKRPLRPASDGDLTAWQAAVPAGDDAGRFWAEAEAARAQGAAVRVTLVGAWDALLPASTALPFVVLRRVSAAEHVLVPFAIGLQFLGLRFAMEVAPGAPDVSAGWAAPFFADPHFEAAIASGCCSWHEGPWTLAAVRHLIVDPEHPLPDEPPVGVAPRLVVLHDVSGKIRQDAAVDAATAAVQRGAAAALVVSADLASPFFGALYLAIVRGRPLDAALGDALAAPGAGVGGYALAAREGGELALQLGHLVGAATQAELASALPQGNFQSDPSPVVLADALGDLLARAHAPRPSVEVSADAGGTRAKRIAAEIVASSNAALVRSADDLRHRVQGALGRVKTAADLGDARLQLAPAATGVASAASVIRSATSASAQSIVAASSRVTNVWIDDRGERVPERALLAVDHDYVIHTQIDLAARDGAASALFPEDAVRGAFAAEDTIPIVVRVDFDPAKAACSPRLSTLQLPRLGPSGEVTFMLRPLAAGPGRVRVGLYHRSALIQSIAVDYAAGTAGEVEGEVSIALDWAASPDLALLDDLSAPAISVWTNDGAEGTHWLGVYAPDPPALAEADLRTFTPDTLEEVAADLRRTMLEIEGLGDPVVRLYAFRDPAPPARLPTPELDRRAAAIVTLAQRGYDAFNTLFFLDEGADAETPRAAALAAALDKPGLLSVARCGSSVTLPWAALYDAPVFTQTSEPALCTVFREQLSANVWSEDGEQLIEKHDLLDDAEACRAQERCPLKQKPGDKAVVCPFGFLGIRHRIEQPLQQVRPPQAPEDDEAPVPRPSEAADETIALSRSKDHPLQIHMGTFPAIAGLDAHRERVGAISGARGVTLEHTDDFTAVRAWLQREVEGDPAPADVYYFVCHGEPDGHSGFRLHFGPLGAPAPFIAPSDVFDVTTAKRRWAQRPVVILNACESVSTTPEHSNKLLIALQRRWASGVVGTEIEIDAGLAQRFGEALLQKLAAGRTLGDAFLDVRRDLLRKLNPLGLAYTFYGSAALHFHDPEACAVAGCPLRPASSPLVPPVDGPG